MYRTLVTVARQQLSARTTTHSVYSFCHMLVLYGCLLLSFSYPNISVIRTNTLRSQRAQISDLLLYWYSLLWRSSWRLNRWLQHNYTSKHGIMYVSQQWMTQELVWRKMRTKHTRFVPTKLTSDMVSSFFNQWGGTNVFHYKPQWYMSSDDNLLQN